ncbi:MAG: LptF/LptG family permease [bacterium]
MVLVHRLLMSSFLRILGYTMAGAIILFTLVDLLENIGSFLDNQATFSMIGRYYLYKTAWIIDIVLPISMLMATLFTVGSMARYNELSALFAAGRSLLQVTQPLILTAVITALLALTWREYVLPEANIGRARVWDVEIHRQPERIRPTSNIALTGEDGRMYHIESYEADTGQITNLRVVTTDEFQVTARIDAASAQWTGSAWLLHEGTRRQFSADTEQVTPFTELVLPGLSLTPETLSQERVRPEDMNITQLRRHIDLVSRSGGDATQGAVDIQFLLAFPVVHIIVVFMGILLASGPRKTTIASGFGLTVLISFGYYLCMNFGRALGHSGALPPVPAAWAGNVLYALIGWTLHLRSHR